MLTLTYLKDKLGGFAEIINPAEQIIESDAGYDGIVALISERPETNPVIILEHPDMFSLGIKPGGVRNSSQNIWVVDMVGADEKRYDVLCRMDTLMRRIIATFINAAQETDDLDSWQWEEIPVMTFNGGANYTGLVFTMYFKEDVDLTLGQFNTTHDGNEGS